MSRARELTWWRGAFRVLVVLACGAGVWATVATAMSAGTPRSLGPSTARAAVTASAATARRTSLNRRAAVRDAKNLLLGVVPPPGAALQTSGEGVGSHARLLTEALASAVAYRAWSVPGDPSAVLSFAESHLPPGSTLVSTGSGGSYPSLQSVIRSWPPVRGVLGARWLELEVSSRSQGGTRLYAESQSQWVVTRRLDEQIPSGVREVDITSGWPGKPPFLSRRVTDRSEVHRLVAVFDSLGIVQPGVISCPGESVAPVVGVGFRAGTANRLVATASVSSTASYTWPATLPGSACFPIAFSVRGHHASPLVGNVITPIQRLLHVTLTANG